MYRTILNFLKLLRGFWWTYIVRDKSLNSPYNPKVYWDRKFYEGPVSDSTTIRSDIDHASALFHHTSIEMLILEHFSNNKVTIENKRILDVGSGAGHWVEFYLKNQASQVTAVDISEKSCKFLSSKYSSNDNVKVINENILQALDNSNFDFDVINAIGVMFILWMTKSGSLR